MSSLFHRLAVFAVIMMPQTVFSQNMAGTDISSDPFGALGGVIERNQNIDSATIQLQQFAIELRRIEDEAPAQAAALERSRNILEGHAVVLRNKATVLAFHQKRQTDCQRVMVDSYNAPAHLRLIYDEQVRTCRFDRDSFVVFQRDVEARLARMRGDIEQTRLYVERAGEFISNQEDRLVAIRAAMDALSSIGEVDQLLETPG